MQEPKPTKASQDIEALHQKNRRQFVRIKRHYFLWFTDKTNPQIRFQVSQVEDISQGGLCFTSNVPLKQGALLQFKLQTPYIEEVVYLDGKVVAVREKVKGLMYSIHIQFDQLTPVVKEVLERIEKYNTK